MYVVEIYSLAISMCFVTMLAWGSWANTQKLASQKWPFQLFYWDYSIGMVIIGLVLAFTMGSMGDSGRSFIPDLQQADSSALGTAFLSGAVFNISNILLVIAIDIAGMAVAFPLGVGLALVIGVGTNYISNPDGNPVLLFAGVALTVLAMILNATAYKRLPSEGNKNVNKGIIISIIAGVLMGFFYPIIVRSMASDFAVPEVGLLTPYTALVIFAIGVFISNFLFNTVVMYKPLSGEKTTYKEYFKLGTPKLHLIGILGGSIWGIGMLFNVVASNTAGAAISYGLGQGATLIAALWGVFVWKEFKGAPKGTNTILAMMFVAFVVGLGLIIAAK